MPRHTDREEMQAQLGSDWLVWTYGQATLGHRFDYIAIVPPPEHVRGRERREALAWMHEVLPLKFAPNGRKVYL